MTSTIAVQRAIRNPLLIIIPVMLILLAYATPAYADGKELVDQKCKLCHTLDRIDAKGQAGASESDWSAMVDRMKSKGCPLTDQESTDIVAYLTETYSASEEAPAAEEATPAAEESTGDDSAAPATDAAEPAAETETAKPAADAATPAEQAQTGAEDWLFPIAGLLMMGMGIILRRRAANLS